MLKIVRKFFDSQDRKNNKLCDDMWLCDKYNVDGFIDIGGFEGKFFERIRRKGNKSKAVIVEPVRSFFDRIEKRIKGRNWIVLHNAVSDKKGVVKFNVLGGHGGTSSILEPTSKIAETTKSGDIVERVEVNAIIIDDIIKDHLSDSKNIFIKVDVQGHEIPVVEGMQKYTDRVSGIRLEMSVDGMDYEGQPKIGDVIEYMRKRGFVLVYLGDAYQLNMDYAHEMTYVDGIFINQKKAVKQIKST